jgi:hypothetical protein
MVSNERKFQNANAETCRVMMKKKQEDQQQDERWQTLTMFLVDYVMHSLCKAHTCHLATHRQMLRKIVKVCSAGCWSPRACLCDLHTVNCCPVVQAEKKPHSGYRAFAVFVFLLVLAFYGALWWYYRQHRCVVHCIA